jgi:NADH:ubiquinone oxidoreductase subunit D
VFAKAKVRLLEMVESVSIIEQCLTGLEKTKEGDIETVVRKFRPEWVSEEQKLPG